ncbi:MAG: hypothetical protein MI741_04655, partial [Rhodospirillales bacterium]|nr:hypothetical protein [Rhodospirillales bacterium]
LINSTYHDKLSKNTQETLIHDRDPLFTKGFRSILQAGGVTCKRLSARSPNLNAYVEWFV